MSRKAYSFSLRRFCESVATAARAVAATVLTITPANVLKSDLDYHSAANRFSLSLLNAAAPTAVSFS